MISPWTNPGPSLTLYVSLFNAFRKDKGITNGGGNVPNVSVSTGTDTCVHTDMWGTANVCVCVHLWGIFAVRELSPPFNMTSCLLDVISYRRKEIRKIDRQQNSTQKCKLHRHGLFPGWRYSVFIFFMSVNPINWPEPADSQYCRIHCAVCADQKSLTSH